MAYRIAKSKNKNGYAYTIIADAYRGKKRTTVVVKTLGNDQEIFERTGRRDAYAYALEVLQDIKNAQEDQYASILIPYQKQKKILYQGDGPKNVGYLFIQKICAELGLLKLSRQLAKEEKCSCDLPSILTQMIAGILWGEASASAASEQMKAALEPPKLEAQDIQQSLLLLAKHTERIQAACFEASKKMLRRDEEATCYTLATGFGEGNSQQIQLSLGTDGLPRSYKIVGTTEGPLFSKGKGPSVDVVDQLEACFRACQRESMSAQEREAQGLLGFLAFYVLRLLEKRCKSLVSSSELLKILRSMKFIEQKGFGYIPIFERTKQTDLLHEGFDFRLDHQIYADDEIQALLRRSKESSLPKKKTNRIIPPRKGT